MDSKQCFILISFKNQLIKLCEFSCVLHYLQGVLELLLGMQRKKLLFSGSFDQSIIIWDIGGQQGTAF